MKCNNQPYCGRLCKCEDKQGLGEKIAKSRAEFEANLQDQSVKPDLRMIGQVYRNPYVEARWRGWRARELT